MKKKLMAFGSAILLFTMPVFAGLIYEWQDYDGLSTSAVGTVEFNDGITIGQFTTNTDLTSFSFTTPNGEMDVWGSGLFQFGDIELSLDGLCVPDCATHGNTKLKKKKIAAKKKKAGGTTDVFFSPVSSLKKKKTSANENNAKWWNWESVPISTGIADEWGYGRWVLTSNVSVPEPATILLLLGALFGMGWVHSRVRR